MSIATSSSGWSASPELQDQYAADIYEYSKRSKSQSIYPGVNFRYLALFLNRQTPTARNILAARRPQATGPTESSRFQNSSTFIVVRSFSPGVAPEVTQYVGDYENQHLTPVCLPIPKPGSGQFVFMRGFASGSWLKAVGAQYRVDPEFFRRHLDFLHSKDYCDLPTLPSNGRNIIQLRLVDVFTRSIPLTRSQIRTARQRSQESIRNYLKTLGQRDVVGESIIRRLSIIDETFFAAEYNISIYIKGSHQRGWTAIVWIDIGRNLDQGPPGPWLDQNKPSWQGDGTDCNPIFQYRPKIALSHNKSDQASGRAQSYGPGNVSHIPAAVDNSNLLQSVSLLPAQYGATLDPEIASKNVLYALREVFVFAANSESQFLNLLNKQINRETDASCVVKDDSIANLKYANVLLNDHVQSIETTLSLLRTWGDMDLPASATAGHAREVQASRTALVTDYEYLRAWAKTLSKRCIDGIGTIANDSQLEEARKAMRQAERGMRLTLMAFVYLPLSLGASIFGMNITELGSGNRSVWTAVTTMVVICLITVLLYFWDKIKSSVWNPRNE